MKHKTVFNGLSVKHFFMEKVLHAKTREARTAQSNTPNIKALTYRNEPKFILNAVNVCFLRRPRGAGEEWGGGGKGGG